MFSRLLAGTEVCVEHVSGRGAGAGDPVRLETLAHRLIVLPGRHTLRGSGALSESTGTCGSPWHSQSVYVCTLSFKAWLERQGHEVMINEHVGAERS